MTSTSRSLQLSWDTAWATAPPSSCQTLLNFQNVIAYGSTCIVPEEDDDPVPDQVNTACMPWLTADPSPSPSAFYSPVTACPDSWTAVATQTSGSGGDWINGETALHCCPDGFIEGDGGNGCKPGNSASWPVVECDEEEDPVSTTYSGSNWPSSVRSSIPALHLRYQATDMASGTSAPSSTSSSSSGGGNNTEDDGLSTGAIAAIATIIPVVLILAAIAGFFLWRRKKNRSAATTTTNNISNEKAAPDSHSSPSGSAATGVAAGGLAGAAATQSSPHATNPHQTPEWNVEMDATETQLQQQQQRANSTYKAPLYAQQNEPAELAGLARVARKPVAPVELDSTPILPEVGDAYIPYRPGR